MSPLPTAYRSILPLVALLCLLVAPHIMSVKAQTAAATLPPQSHDPNATNNLWGGCVDPNNPEALVTSGEPTTICVVLASNTEWNVLAPATRYLRLSFQPTVDQFSLLHIPKSYQDLIQLRATTVYDGSNDVGVHAESQQVVSYQRKFWDQALSRAFPYLTTTIYAEKGVVKQIYWDDACAYCDSSQCMDNLYDFNGNLATSTNENYKACYVDKDTCMLDELQQCNLALQVVWSGTDANGKSLDSACQLKYDPASCSIPVEAYDGPRLLNGNAMLVVPVLNATSNEMLPFALDQMENTGNVDVNYFSSVRVLDGESTSCGAANTCSRGVSTTMHTVYISLVVSAMVACLFLFT